MQLRISRLSAAEKTGFGFLVDCWNKSDSLSDFNALTAAKICGLLGLNALFFEYSRLPSAALDKQLTFFDEHQREFVSAFNASLRKRRLAGAKPMAENELPLWRVERDGTKKQLLVGEKAAQGERIAFKAVARNIAFASLLGSGVYVSGGGALSEERGYAGVAHDVAQALGAVEPETVVWRNKDVYRSSEARETRDLNGLEKQVSELKALLRAAKEKESAFLAETRGSESENKSKNAGLEADFETRRQTLFEEKKRAEREFQKKQVKFLEVKRAAKTENSIFSIADLLRVVDAGRVKREWCASLDAAKPARKEFYLEYATMTRFF